MLVLFLCFIDDKFLREKRKVIVCGFENWGREEEKEMSDENAKSKKKNCFFM
jgi:hypothetical protein